MASKPGLIALNIGLAAGLVLIAWQGRVKWQEAQAARTANLNVPVKRVTIPPIASTQKPDGVQATKYADVATKDLFSKDRNPTVIVEAPKVEAPKPMPPLPVVYGVLGLPSGVKAIMAERSGSGSKSVHAGDTIGDFKILALDTRKVTFEWDGKQIEKNLDDLIDRTGGATAGSGPAPSGPAAPAAPKPSSNTAPASNVMGAEISTPDGPARACKPGDSSAVGATVDGYKKTAADSPFGPMNCRWVQSK